MTYWGTRLAMLAGAFLLLWLVRGEAAHDPVGFACPTVLLFGLVGWGAARRDEP